MYGVLVDISTIFFPQIMSSQCQEMHASWSWPDGTLVTVGVTFTLKPARRPPNSISQHAVNRRFAMPQKMVEFSCVIHVSFMELMSLTWHLATGNCHSFFFPAAFDDFRAVSKSESNQSRALVPHGSNHGSNNRHFLGCMTLNYCLVVFQNMF